MPLKTGRFYEPADVKVDHQKCTLCGLCVKVCKGAPLIMTENTIHVDQNRVFGCIGCGQCMAVCPHDAIQVNGRDMSPDNIIDLPPVAARATYHSLKSLMMSRRSMRNYRDKNVEGEIIEQIIAAAATAPSGLGATDVEILVLDGKDKVQEFSGDLIGIIKKNKWFFSPVMLKIYRPFIGKDMYELMKSFVHTATNVFVKGYEQGEDWLTFSAPLAMFFHTSQYSDPVDPYIPATYAMLAAESLGLGSCMLGSINYLLRYFGKGLKDKYGIPLKNKNGLMVVFGYPDVKYCHGVKRKFAKVKFY